MASTMRPRADRPPRPQPLDVAADGWSAGVIDDRVRRLQAAPRSSVSVASPAECLHDLAQVVDRQFLLDLFVGIAELVTRR